MIAWALLVLALLGLVGQWVAIVLSSRRWKKHRDTAVSHVVLFGVSSAMALGFSIALAVWRMAS